MNAMVTLKFTKEQLRWLVDQIETSFEEGQLSKEQEDALKILRSGLHKK